MRWQKPALWFLLLALIFGAGVGTGLNLAHRSDHHVRTVFTPQEDGIGEYLKFLDKARVSVDIACYAFTDARITEKLVELRKRGVKVRVLLDKSQTLGRSAPYIQQAIEALRAAGAEVIVGTSEKRHEIMHNKFTIVDGIYVQDGSWNYTKSANFQNNVLNFDDDPVRAAKFQDNWNRMHDFMIKQNQNPGAKK
jgi:phosphatidylserine/phosphatidylglycerophosphate/cardiolipin synthase-like enzyme